MQRVLPSFLACFFTLATTADAGPIDRALMKLAPEERAHQACIIKGIETVRKDKRLRQADRMKTSILGPAQFTGTVVTATGGAVRMQHHWYALKFTCSVTDDQMKATSFTFELGQEIPKEKWEDYGLWE
jgi:Domain of Unknown Function (DUF930)